jgi:hypothetical protein
MRTALIAAFTAFSLLWSWLSAGDARAGRSSSHTTSSVRSPSHASSSVRSPPPSRKPVPHPVVTVSRSRHPESAQHIKDAQAAGHPKTVTVNRGGAKANRAASLKGIKPQSGKDRDEYPPAMFQEGGQGASVRHIEPSDNRGAGSCIGAQCRHLKDGDKVRIKVVK